MEGSSQPRGRRLTATMREAERVMPLELFFDLVFVLALTQCTALMVDSPTWQGIGHGLLVLTLLWWAWSAYAWLTSVLDPEEGGVRLVLAAAMAALLIAALAVPEAFTDSAMEFAIAYGAVRVAHIGLFAIAGRDDPALARSVAVITVSTGVGIGLLIAGAAIGGNAQVALWIAAAVFDLGTPFLFGSEGWKLMPSHFAERFGLIVIVALGESIVALGVGADVGLSLGVTVAAVLGVLLVFELWWVYFDIVAIANVRRLVRAEVGKEQNELARDVYSYLHLPLVAGIELAAFGLHDVLAHPGEHLDTVHAFALLGGIAIYLLGHVAIRLRGAHTWNLQRLVVALVLFALIAVAGHVSALLALAIATALLAAMIGYETRSYGEVRTSVRHDFAVSGALATFGEEERD